MYNNSKSPAEAPLVRDNKPPPLLASFFTFCVLFKGRNLPLHVPAKVGKFGGYHHSHPTSVLKRTRKEPEYPCPSPALQPPTGLCHRGSAAASKTGTPSSVPTTKGCVPSRANSPYFLDKHVLMPSMFKACQEVQQ